MAQCSSTTAIVALPLTSPELAFLIASLYDVPLLMFHPQQVKDAPKSGRRLPVLPSLKFHSVGFVSPLQGHSVAWASISPCFLCCESFWFLVLVLTRPRVLPYFRRSSRKFCMAPCHIYFSLLFWRTSGAPLGSAWFPPVVEFVLLDQERDAFPALHVFTIRRVRASRTRRRSSRGWSRWSTTEPSCGSKSPCVCRNAAVRLKRKTDRGLALACGGTTACGPRVRHHCGLGV